jgi:hypothetical protein
MRDELIRDMEAMEQCMERTADRCDIWQDRLIYAIYKAVYDLLKWAVRKEKNKWD